MMSRNAWRIGVAAVIVAVTGVAAMGQGRLNDRPVWMRTHELTSDLVLHAPGGGDFDVFEIAYGVELGYRYWFTDVLGAGIGVGFERWSADGTSRNWPGRADGDLQVVPLSLGGYVRAVNFRWAELIGFIAVEYGFVNSDVTIETDGVVQDVDIDNPWDLRLGLELAVPLTPDLSISFGAGHQFPIVKSDASTAAGPLMDADLQSFFFSLGLQLAF
ncbi:MAG: hypothetical protein N2652_09595 [Kiritimatiellae bacterium]|nr:hypothetical protein [Kiritimatiellia bacterium]